MARPPSGNSVNVRSGGIFAGERMSGVWQLALFQAVQANPARIMAMLRAVHGTGGN